MKVYGNEVIEGTVTAIGFAGDGSAITGIDGSGATWTVSPRNASFTAEKSHVYPVDASSDAVVATLPSGSTINQQIYIKKTDSSANTVTLQAAGSDLIDGQATAVISIQWDTLTVISDGSGNWYII